MVGIRKLGRAGDAVRSAELPQSRSRYLTVTWNPELGSAYVLQE